MNYFGYEKQCALCGKEFIVHDEWAYRSNKCDGAMLFCSWSCLQAWRENRGSKAERREKLIQAINDGLTTSEICKLLNEEPRNILYWRKKLEGEKDDA